MGRKSLKETRRLEIIKVFYQVAKKEGYENTSIAKIAKVMDINPSLIIHYFETKEGLTYELIDHILDRYLLIYTIKNKGKAKLDDLQATIEMLFSKKWNLLFDDGLFYTFYALAFREKKIKLKYKLILDALRNGLALMIEQCNEQQITNVENPQVTADFIFVLVDGAYFYLSMESDKKAYLDRLAYYKQKAYDTLSISPLKAVSAPVC
ncbi:HTH-type transcriptional regulator BetI [Pedobacter sp. Bi27]|uniref:TetR family transcriptional regulator n=1 Tax=unclassified Pedobacter TaxID=2628915 RepID=UPI001D4227F1|nr:MULTISPECIES: TetR family transcriptional regulator [unclassified Pedobacter]CAH0262537.1 HTH-type transcriptional regulator BetI [Pedobacter sp. Bi36]CAH0289238.1 HTH-type transcriptional regulator BetI [Pedobacter sp. Bi126]CAH0292613.1 HTH-type transcriptional regulator BetI [Pedobacter sp. Bi27]